MSCGSRPSYRFFEYPRLDSIANSKTEAEKEVESHFFSLAAETIGRHNGKMRLSVNSAMPKRLLIALCALLPIAAKASVTDTAGSIVTMIFGLVIVLAAFYGLLHLLKRLQSQGVSGQAKLSVIGAVPVGPRERVVLVEIGDRVLVLGVAPGHVGTLGRLSSVDVPRNPTTAPVAQDFAARLAKIIKGGRDAR